MASHGRIIPPDDGDPDSHGSNFGMESARDPGLAGQTLEATLINGLSEAEQNGGSVRTTLRKFPDTLTPYAMLLIDALPDASLTKTLFFQLVTKLGMAKIQETPQMKAAHTAKLAAFSELDHRDLALLFRKRTCEPLVPDLLTSSENVTMSALGWVSNTAEEIADTFSVHKSVVWNNAIMAAFSEGQSLLPKHIVRLCKAEYTYFLDWSADTLIRRINYLTGGGLPNH